MYTYTYIHTCILGGRVGGATILYYTHTVLCSILHTQQYTHYTYYTMYIHTYILCSTYTTLYMYTIHTLYYTHMQQYTHYTNRQSSKQYTHSSSTVGRQAGKGVGCCLASQPRRRTATHTCTCIHTHTYIHTQHYVYTHTYIHTMYYTIHIHVYTTTILYYTSRQVVLCTQDTTYYTVPHRAGGVCGRPCLTVIGASGKKRCEKLLKK